MNNYQILAERLKELRNRLNLTQNQFCEKIGFTQATLSSYENATKTPSLDILLKIIQTFDVSLDWLLGLKSDQSFELTTVSDVIRVLLKLDDSIMITIVDTQKLSASFKIDDELISDFAIEWTKMKNLHKEKVIDDDVYNLWIEKTLIKYNVPIDEFGIYTIADDLPF